MNTTLTHDLAELMLKISEGIDSRTRKHGTEPFVNHMEGLGVVTEEYLEYVEACRSNDWGRIEKEALDLCVAAAWVLMRGKK